MARRNPTNAAFHQDEVDASWLYGVMAGLERDPRLAEVYRRLAATERGHAVQFAGASPASRPSWRARTLALLARRFGAGAVLPVLIARERAGARGYARANADTPLAAQELSHARVLAALAGPAGAEGSVVARLEGRHRTIGGNALRAAVLGANDGLVSNLSLVMGVAGAALAPDTILITGLAGLLAGAGSMAMGEWLSVQSSRELYQRQIDLEAAELAASPAEEAEELTLIYQAKGLAEAEARALGARMVADRGTALDTLAREELGVDPDELGGSAWQAAATSFVLFAVGAVLPVLPFALLDGPSAVAASLVVSAVALFGIGAGITLLTGKSVLRSGARQLAIGLGAAGLTYLVGHLIGVQIAG
jgi:VIT1/CCC1 family predicted Fe2+/Mn2+ transporter